MRIGLVTPAWPGKANGITTAVSHLVSGFAETGHETTIIPIQDYKIDDPRVINLPLPRSWTLKERIYAKLGRNIASVPILADRIAQAAERAVRERGIEALIIEETQGWGATIQPRISIPLIITLHGPWFIHRKLIPHSDADIINHGREKREGQALRMCAGIIAPSQDVMDQTLDRYDLSDIPKAVISNPMPLKPAINYATLDKVQKRSLLFVGRFDKIKGGDLVFEAFAQLIGMGVDAWLTFVGPDTGIEQPDGGRLHIDEALATLPDAVRTRIQYLGLLKKAEIEILRQKHAITLIASRHETFSYTLLEALAAGSATIATAVGGPAEIIRNGETGLLVPPNAPTALATSCRHLINAPALCSSLGKNARADVKHRFSPCRISNRVEGFLKKSQDLYSKRNQYLNAKPY